MQLGRDCGLGHHISAALDAVIHYAFVSLIQIDLPGRYEIGPREGRARRDLEAARRGAGPGRRRPPVGRVCRADRRGGTAGAASLFRPHTWPR